MVHFNPKRERRPDMGFIQAAKERVINYDLAVTVPYDKTGEGGVTFYLRQVPVMRRTETAPEEGGHWETVHIKGFHYDDDLPNLEDEAFAMASEVMDLREVLR
jgi:hypothetical protein